MEVDDAGEHQRLKDASVRGVVINVVSQSVRLGLRFAYQIAIARMLLPRDFGLVAMAAPVIAFVQIFSDLGLSQATIQHRDITQEQLSFMFWLNLATGLLLALVCAVGAPVVAEFYGDARVANVMYASAALLFAGSLCSQHMAILNRHMRFGALAVLDIGSLIIGALIAIAAAMMGAGYWALLINQAATTAAMVLIAWGVTRWRPGRIGPFDQMKPLLNFGGNLTVFNFLSFFSRNTDNILIGRFNGEYALGLYDRAFKLMLLPFGQISIPFSKVAVPLLSRCQDQPDVYRHAYRRMLEAVLLLLYPGLVFMVAESHELILIALGQRWIEVAPIFAILGIDAFVAPLGYSMGWLFVSQGRTREMRNWGALTAVLFVSCFVIGLHWGAEGVAAGYATAGFLEISFLWRVATRRGPLPGPDFLLLVVPFLFGIAVTFGVLLALRLVLPPGVPSLLCEASTAYIAFALGLTLFPRGRRVLREVWKQVRGFLSRFGL